MVKPLVTVITPVYRYRITITNCIMSVMNQSYDNIEYLIIDDGPNSIEDDELMPLLSHNKIKSEIIHNSTN